ncbi:P-loop containing nucleoside triphosphate hydrolase protein, partial [Glonium stellatum]
LIESLNTGSVSKIDFENLWMLFDSGDTIYSRFQEGGQVLQNDEDETHTTKRRFVPQAYRILATAGGIPLKKTLARKAKKLNTDLSDEPSPGLLKYPDGMDNAELARIPGKEAVPTHRKMKSMYSPLYVYCFYIDFDGSKYGTVTEIFYFKPYDEKADITSLDAYPVRFLKSKEPAVDALLERGRKFIDVTAVSHMSYEGLTVGETKEEINSAIIVDFKLAFQEPDADIPKFSPLNVFWHSIKETQVVEFFGSFCGAPSCFLPGCLSDRYAGQQKKQREKTESKIRLLLEEQEIERSDQNEGFTKLKQYMEENDLIALLPGVVPGFALRNRKWVQVDLSRLKHVKREDNWNALVLPKGHRKMVQAMVETHARGTSSPTGHQAKIEMDLVRGKGKGCIILLHGAPGVGKTSTAECVAAYTERPLYPITCGDIGYVPDDVEANMEKHFKLAHKWGCVLLLDEADVFLAKRNKEDIKRNGLVSVFLRILEYYSGILFLTTNRVGTIDDAFRSRLHLTLYYPKLTKEQTIKIWKKNLERMANINEEREKNGLLVIKFNEKKIQRWAKKHWITLQWNGRQIRNAFQTAVALGEFEARNRKSRSGSPSTPKLPVMDVKYFKIIAKASIQFNEYLRQTHGADEEKIAKREMIRVDEGFDAESKMQALDDSMSDSATSSDDSSNEGSDDTEKDESSDSSSGSESEKDQKSKKKGKRQKSKGRSDSKSKSVKEEKKDKEKSKGKRRN